MTAKVIREKFINFFKSSPRNHVEISPAPLVLESDPTTLFTSSGMQPLVPYLLGEPHPSGSKRLVNFQPSIRTVDIEEVGDNRHLTFFEMLGNWSLGDYFKKEQISWFYEFLTKELLIPSERLWVSVFEGNDQVPKDEESASIWQSLGIEKERIFFYGVEKNWWSRSGTPDEMPIGEIGGPDSEVFFDFDPGERLGIHAKSPYRDTSCHPNCDCGRFLEIGNSVFIQYKKAEEAKLEELSQKNVDFGGGLERITAAVNGDADIYKTDLFESLLKKTEYLTGLKYEDKRREFRVIADHIKASVFLIASGVQPSNKLHGYVLRRLIRRSAVKIYQLAESLAPFFIVNAIGNEVLRIYEDLLSDQGELSKRIESIFEDELTKFGRSLHKGLQIIKKSKNIDGKLAFDLYQTYGFPLELTRELAQEKGQKIDQRVFDEEFEKHRKLSQTLSAGVFKGGLADSSPEVIRLHTATHLLLASLRKILGEHVVQMGQNITRERSRFDFSHPQKLTDEQLRKVEEMINGVIQKDLPVNFKVLPKDEALRTGAIHAFNEKYSDTVKVYYIGENLSDAFSKEFCGGPHVLRTRDIGRVRIKKQEKIGAGLIRIYIVLE